MLMQELGLLQLWKRRFMSATDRHVSRCQSVIHSEVTEAEKQSETKPLTLESLSGAFIILLVGYLIATAVFLFERLIRSFKKDLKVETKIVSEQIALVVVSKIEPNKAEKAPEPQNQLTKVGETVLSSSEESRSTANDTVIKPSQSHLIVPAIKDSQGGIIVSTQEVPEKKVEKKEGEEKVAAIIKLSQKTYDTKTSLDKIILLNEKVHEKQAEPKKVKETVSKAPSKPKKSVQREVA